MNIFLLYDFPADKQGGATLSGNTIAKVLAEKGHNVYILCPTMEEKILLDDNINILQYKQSSNKMLDALICIRFIYEKVRTLKPDVLHAQFPKSAVLSLIIKNTIYLNKPKIMYTDRFFYDEYSKKYKVIFKSLGKFFDRIVCTTELNAERWRVETKVQPQIIHNVLDEDWYDYSEEKELACKRQYNTINQFTIGFAGRYTEYKRWDIVEKIINQRKEHRYMMIISASESKKIELRQYIERIKSIENISVEIIEDGNMNQMKQFYYAIDMFILTSDNESFGRTLIEAMTKNNIVLGSDSGGVPNVLFRNEDLFDNKTEEIYKLIDMYSDNKELSEKVSRDNREYVNTKFSYVEYCEKILGSYKY